MFISVNVLVDPQAGVPTQGRAAWLATHGPVTQSSAVVGVSLDANDWEARGVTLNPDATVTLTDVQRGLLADAVLAFIGSTGVVPSTFPANLALAALGG